MEKETLKNANCVVTYDPEKKSIFGQDLTDHFNDPAFYSKTKRGIKAAWECAKIAFSPTSRMWDVMAVLNSHGVRTHSWCMVD